MQTREQAEEVSIRLAPRILWEQLGPEEGVPYVPFEGQLAIHHAIKFPAPPNGPDERPYPRIWALNTGRQFGKTIMLVALASEALIADWGDGKGPPHVKVAADSEERARKVWDKFVQLWTTRPALSKLIKSYSKERELIELWNGAKIQLVTLDNPNNASGDTVTTWIIDESQYLSFAAWINLLPTVTVRRGIIVMAGVSQGEGPFREVCWKGLRENRAEYPLHFRFRFTSYDNPHQDRAAIDATRDEMTAEDFENLYLAIWSEETSKPFPEIDHLFDRTLMPRLDEDNNWSIIRPPIPGKNYYGGCDLAWSRDYNLLFIADDTGTVVAWTRFTKKPQEITVKTLAGLAKMYNRAKVGVDTHGMGGQILEEALRKAGMNVHAVPIKSNAAKVEAITSLQLRVERHRLRLPLVKFIREELSRFEKKSAKIGQNVLVRYGAPNGRNDDAVIALALLSMVLPKKTSGIDRGQTQRQRQRRARQEGLWEQIA